MSVSSSKKTAAKKTAATPEKEVATEVSEPEQAAATTEAEQAADNEADGPDAAATTDTERDDSDEEVADPEQDDAPDSAMQAATASSAQRSQMASATQAREYAASLADQSDDEKRSNGLRAVAARDKASLEAELTAGRTTPGPGVQETSDGHKRGTGPNDTITAADLSGLAGPSQDALNPAFAV